MQNIGVKIVFLLCVLAASLAVASVMNTPEFHHIRAALSSWF